jgi:SpoVK/Ycf46/Vps4 family AAA+-type ATPase
VRNPTPATTPSDIDEVVKHFEDIWEEAEGMSEDVPLASRIKYIKELADNFLANKDPEVMGELLFQLTGISKEENINVAAALKNHIDGLKIDRYE